MKLSDPQDITGLKNQTLDDVKHKTYSKMIVNSNFKDILRFSSHKQIPMAVFDFKYDKITNELIQL